MLAGFSGTKRARHHDHEILFRLRVHMWDEQMKKRCPRHRKVGHAVLAGYRWIITTRGYASVVPSPGDEVEGVLFEVSPTDEEALDGFEGGLSDAYVRTQVRKFVPA